MIFGKTTEQRKQENEEKIKLAAQPREWFAWYPVQIEDGRWVWLETVYRRKHIIVDVMYLSYSVKQ